MDIFVRLAESTHEDIANRFDSTRDWGEGNRSRFNNHLQGDVLGESMLHQIGSVVVFRANVGLDGFLGGGHDGPAMVSDEDA